MANIKIYRDNAAGLVFFENSTANPLPVNIGVATEVAGEATRIKIVRTDKFIKGTNNFRVLFKRLKFNRIEDKDGNTFATRADALNYLTTTFAQAAPVDVNSAYLGVWNATANNPDIVALTPTNGDWFYVTQTGSIDPNGNGSATGSINYKVDDIVKYVSGSNFTGWQYVPNETVRVSELDSTLDNIIQNSSLTQFDIHVVAHYTGSENLGTAIKPYVDIQQAISASSTGDAILLDGNFTVTASVELPLDKSLHFYGAGETTVRYSTFSPVNGNLFQRASGDATNGFQFKDLTFKNAGGYGLDISQADHIYITDCTFNTNGWNGTGLSTVASGSGGVVGYNSSQADLLTFGSGSNVSNGGAMEISNTRNVQVIGNTVQANFRGIKLEDCGIGGNMFVTRNVASGNIESGIYLGAGALHGTQNCTVSMNFVGYNSNNGLLVVGGINNKFSQNEVTGNWNGGFVSWGAANTTIRDSGFYDNNRSAYNGIGANGDADASILINDSFSFLQTNFHMNSSARFITEILGCQIQNTGLGSNTEKVGVALTAGMGSIPDSDMNIIRIDDCGFIAQDYAIDFSACNVTNLRISLGDNTYEGTGQFAVKSPAQGNYAELPFSSHVTDVSAVDILTDVLRQSVTLTEGIGGNVINVYKVNELRSYINGGNNITILQRNSDRIQLRSLALSEATINGASAGATQTAVNNNLNAAFQLTLEQYQGIVVTPLLDALTPISGYNTPLVGSLVGDDLSNGGVVQTTDTTAAGERIFIPSGSITVGTTFGFLTGNTISTTPTLSDWEFVLILDETGSLTFRNTDGTTNSTLFQAGTTAGEPWTRNIIVDLKANGTTIDFATSNLLTTASILPAESVPTYSTEITAGTYNLTFFNQSGSGTLEIPADTEVLEGAAPVGLSYHYIESPNGVFHYPLFSELPQAQYEDSRVGGPGSGSAYTFVDDLSGQGTWYAPDTSYSGSVNVSPVNGTPTGVTWNEIANGADENYAPSAISPFTSSLNEATALNLEVTPAGATFTTTISNHPAWISLSGQSLIGTAPEVGGDLNNYPVDNYNVDITRTNSYGSTTTTVLFEVNNLTPLLSLPGTIHTGSVIAGSGTNNAGVVYPGPTGSTTVGQFVYDIDTLEDGDTIQWYHQEQYLGFGIVSSGIDKTTNILAKDSAPGTRWDLLAPFTGVPSSAQGQNFGNVYGMVGLVPVGWDNNTNPQAIPTRPVYAASDIWKLYNNAGTIELSLNDVLFRSSSATYTDPTITFATPAFLEDTTLPMPTFSKLSNGAAAPAGFTLTSGSMDTSLILNSGSVTTLDSLTLSPGQRMIASEAWVESNLLPNIPLSPSGAPYFNRTYVGIVSQSADWSTITAADFNAAHSWRATTIPNQIINQQAITGSTFDSTTINSSADAYFSYAIDFGREGNLTVLRQTAANPSLTTEPVGGTFTAARTFNAATASIGTAAQSIAIATEGKAKARLNLSGLSVIDSPIPANQFDITEDGSSLPLFNGAAGTTLTLNAGTTYKFWMDSSTIEAADTLSFALISDNSAYTTGVTTIGTPGTFGAYVEFAIPSAVPPIRFKWVSTGSGTTYILPTIAGSTYTVPVTDVTNEGPATPTGTRVSADNWYSIDETLAAGERIIFNGTFFQDLWNAMPGTYNNTALFGIKASTWSNSDNGNDTSGTISSQGFEHDLVVRLQKNSSTSGELRVLSNYYTQGASLSFNQNGLGALSAFIEITPNGNNIRMGITNNIATDNLTSTIYSDWSANKGQTGDQGYGITTRDVMMFWAKGQSSSGFDYDDIDWTELSEVAVPTTSGRTTDWDKAIDFSGGNEYLKQQAATQASPFVLTGTLVATAASGRTTADNSGRPWATSVVFNLDGNSSNQYIWNYGEGNSTGDDNIYLRVDSSRVIYFGWGRQGNGYNECRLGTFAANKWYGLYISHDGSRVAGSSAAANILAGMFSIRHMSETLSFGTLYAEKSTTANWTAGSTGKRLDRATSGDFTIGGRSGNDNFYGKVASMVTTTLLINQVLPTDAEIVDMITDPAKWLTDYKVGNTYRYPWSSTTRSNWSMNHTYSAWSTQVWLMGDGTIDSFTNNIRNLSTTADLTTRMQFNNMVSNDIETVTITGLT